MPAKSRRSRKRKGESLVEEGTGKKRVQAEKPWAMQKWRLDRVGGLVDKGKTYKGSEVETKRSHRGEATGGKNIMEKRHKGQSPVERLSKNPDDGIQ